MITSLITVVRPMAPGVAPGTALQAGPTGLSAYQVAVAAGYTGTAAQWVASLQGPPGAPPTTAQMQAAVQALIGAAGGLAPLDQNGDVPLDNLQVRTGQVTNAVKPALRIAGGSFSAFLSGLNPDAEDGTWNAVYTEAFAPLNGILAAQLTAYLVTALGQSPGQAQATLQTVWAAAAALSP